MVQCVQTLVFNHFWVTDNLRLSGKGVTRAGGMVQDMPRDCTHETHLLPHEGKTGALVGFNPPQIFGHES